MMPRVCIAVVCALVAVLALADYSFIVTPAAETVVSVDSWSGSLAVRGQTANAAAAESVAFVDSRGRTFDYGVIRVLNTNKMTGLVLVVR